MAALYTRIKNDGSARLGTLAVNGQEIPTPVFMPVGTNGTVKALTPRQTEETGSMIVLANTYHLTLRPGLDVLKAAGGIKRFSGYPRAMLTDSGGFQVFSLARQRTIEDEGVVFRSHIDGSEFRFTPESATRAQHIIGADFIMAFDECANPDADWNYAKAAMERTVRWARICKETHDESENAQTQFLGAIAQGGFYKDLRLACIETLNEMEFPLYAIGGVSVGEGYDVMEETLSYAVDALPRDTPRYLMGVGEPKDILMAVGFGIDMFDCVMPTRNARNGEAFTFDGVVRIRNSEHRFSTRPLEETCDCYACKNFNRAYLRHLAIAKEMLFATLMSIHNLRFMQRFMEAIRAAIAEQRFSAFRNEFLLRFYSANN